VWHHHVEDSSSKVGVGLQDTIRLTAIVDHDCIVTLLPDYGRQQMSHYWIVVGD
jgi:hypothetical protein